MRLFLFIMAVCLLTTSFARAASPAITSFMLKNGMEVVVIENHRAPAVSHMLWFRVGGADDPLGKSGLAHFHEHLMFKATKDFPAGHYSKEIHRLGGEQNAFTSFDATGYYADIHIDALPKVMALEAARMRGIILTDEDITKEREVIIEERRSRTDNNPAGQFYEQMRSTLLTHHPYGTPLIGYKHEMEALNREDVMQFHHRYHKPTNAILVLSGAINEARAQELAKQYYGDINAGEAIVASWTQEPTPLAARRVQMVHENVTHPSWRRMWLAPSVALDSPTSSQGGDTQHSLPLMLFAEVFGGGKTSVLYKELVEKQKLATSASVSYDGFSRGPDTFTLYVTPSVGVDLANIEAAVEVVLARTLKEGMDGASIGRAKTQFKADTLYAREGIGGMARIMGMMRILNLPIDYFNDWPNKVDAVTAEQMQAAARAVLSADIHVTGTLMPKQEKK